MTTTLLANKTATRADFDEMAVRYFESRKKMADGRQLDDAEDELSHQLELTRTRIAELEDQILRNAFDQKVSNIADRLMSALGTTREKLDDHLARYADQVAARADRQQLRYLAHSLSAPASTFAPDDERFIARTNTPPITAVSTPAQPAPTVADLGVQLIARKRAQNLGASHVSEMERVFGWLVEELGSDRRIDDVTKPEMRKFRDNLGRLNGRLRGQALPFKARLTDNAEDQIKSVTAERYWRSVLALFEYAQAEHDVEANPTDRLRYQLKKGERVDSPEAFSNDEVKGLMTSPLYGGHAKGRSGYSKPGNLRDRRGHFWSGLLALFTGARAGELNQLLPTDFVFDVPIPYIRVTTEDGSGAHTKQLKNTASVRNVPIHSTLLALGLRAYVETLAKHYPGRRVLHEFEFGSAGRRSEGLTRFWAKYLGQVGLKKPGRATHVFRHTVVAALRAAGVAEEDVCAVVGHKRTTVTAGYGGEYPISRVAETIEKISYGLNVVELLQVKSD